MTATADEIESALLAPWVSPDGIAPPEWTATAPELVAFDNVGFQPPSDNTTPWVEVAVNNGYRRLIGVNDGYVGYPSVTVTANVPLGQGKAALRQLLDAAADLYYGKILKAGTSILTAYSFSSPQPVPRDGWFAMSMQVSFHEF